MSLSVAVLVLLLLLAVVQLLLQKYSPLAALLVSLSAGGFLLFRIGTAVQPLLQKLLLLAQHTDGQAFRCLLRCAGILLLTDYTRTLCEEAGADSLGWCADLAGRCLVIAAAFPMLEEIGQKIWGITG